MSVFAALSPVLSPKTLDDALQVLNKDRSLWKPLAGGTDLMVLLETQSLTPRGFLNLMGIKELKGITVHQDWIHLGALTTYSEIQNQDILKREFPLLTQAAGETGTVAIQNRGTVGGNIANGSPAADFPPALLVYDAEILVASTEGTRSIPYHRFHTGYKAMELKPHELITGIQLSRRLEKTHEYFRKVGPRKAQAISKVCMAALAKVEGGKIQKFRLALGAVAPFPLRCARTEKLLEGKILDETIRQMAVKTLAGEISPIDDIRSTKVYRTKVSQNLLEEFLESLPCQTG